MKTLIRDIAFFSLIIGCCLFLIIDIIPTFIFLIAPSIGSKIQLHHEVDSLDYVLIGMALIVLIVAVILYYSLQRGKKEYTLKKDRLNRILDALPFAVHLSDVNNRFMKIYRNPADLEMLGDLTNNTPEEREKRHHYNARHQIDEEVLKSKKRFLGQYLIENRNGEKHESLISKTLIDYKNKRYILTEINDVDELIKTRKHAELSDQMKSSFLANMSHDIRTPLNAIIGFSSLLQDCKDPDVLKEYSETILCNNQQMLNLVDQVLEISQIDSKFIHFNDQWVDIIEYQKELEHLFEHLFNSGNVSFNIYCPYLSFLVLIDKARLTQIIGNFVTNAHKFTQQGSVELGILYFKYRFIIYVSDSGCGIEEEKQKLVFRRFAKLNQTATGTGLGMAICQSIVESRNGHIGVYSKVGEGSIFYTVLLEKVKKIHPDKIKFKNINHILEHIDIFPGKTFI
jgi:signal transduction histidine kinase